MPLPCYRCQKELDLAPATNFSKRETCPYCSCDLHCCKMCQFYDPSCYNECREPMAEKISDKEKANFCDYFRSHSGKKLSAEEIKQAQIEKLKSLFKNS